MFHFEPLLCLGARVAAMSDVGDGDCRLDDDADAEPRRRFLQACGVEPSRLVVGRQTHSANVAVVTSADRHFPNTDGLITNREGVPLGVSVADCVPVFLFEPVARAAGVVHAGRIGTFANISGAAVNAMCDALECDPARIHAVIGPSAGPGAYEVSEEIAEEFRAAGLPVRGRLIDLWRANALQLERSGVPAAHIHITGICTITSGRFHSHRAHGNGARNLAVISL